jgi:hypothetical protein
MISSFTNGSLKSFYPWVLSHPKDIEFYGPSLFLILIDICSPMISLSLGDIVSKIHPHVECSHLTPPIMVFDSLSSHDFLDIEFISDKAIMGVMDYIVNPTYEVMY